MVSTKRESIVNGLDGLNVNGMAQGFSSFWRAGKSCWISPVQMATWAHLCLGNMM